MELFVLKNTNISSGMNRISAEFAIFASPIPDEAPHVSIEPVQNPKKPEKIEIR